MVPKFMELVSCVRAMMQHHTPFHIIYAHTLKDAEDRTVMDG